MSREPDSLDDVTNSTAYLFEQSNTAGASSPHLRNEAITPRVSPDRETLLTLTDLRRQVQNLTRQLADERQINQKLLAISEFGKDFDHAPDPERIAGSMAKMLHRLIHCDLVCIFAYQPAEQRFKNMGSAGPAADLLPGGFQPELTLKIVSLAIASQSVLSSRDLRSGYEPLHLEERSFPSLLAAPIFHNGSLRGVILLAGTSDQLLTAGDNTLVAAAGVQLLNAWTFARQNETLTEFVQTVTMMSMVQEAGSLMEMIASIARRTLGAAFTLVATRNQQEWMLRGSGRAPQLLHSLQNEASSFLEQAIQSPYTFRLRDLRKDERAAAIQLDYPGLSSLLACPIRINGMITGILLAFGKTGTDSFTDSDVFLAELLVAHAAVNLESCYLNQELRASLKTTELLYNLSLNISRAGCLTDAAHAIALTAYRLLQARKCGLLLFASDGQVEAEVHFPADDPTIAHPYRLIQQAMDSRQTIYLAENETLARSAIPIQTMRRCYGALWIEYPEDNEETRHPAEEIRILINQAAVALERSILLEETRQKASEITQAYEQLELSYDQTLRALTRAQDMRDNDTERHSERVMELAVRLGVEMGLPAQDLKILERGALLHDIGKIGVPDGILRKSGPLSEDEWEEMRKHPEEGAKIIQEIPFLSDALPVIAYHQERWDGSGYPQRLRGAEIPLLARIFAVVDVFDALTSQRIYREAKLSYEEALEYLEDQAGKLFDPDVVNCFAKMIRTAGQPESA